MGFGEINVESFETENKFDKVVVNGDGYSGTSGPDGVIPTTDIVWTSDGSRTKKGWRICQAGAPTPPPPPFTVTGNCHTDSDNCVTSGGFSCGSYDNSQSCTISKEFGEINVESFETENKFDKVVVNGDGYSGPSGPDGVIPTTDIVWTSDGSLTKKGWKICPVS